jgi:hypothetical protein
MEQSGVEDSETALSRSFSVFDELTGGELLMVGLNPRVWVQGLLNFSQDYSEPHGTISPIT